MKILIAVDFSESSRIAVDEVSRRPWPAGTEVRLLTVVQPLEFTSAQVFVPEFTGNTIAATREALEKIGKGMSREGLVISTDVEPGSPRGSIGSYADLWGADFVYLGSRGRNAFQRMLLGSVAKSVMRHAPCSVGVIRRRRPGPPREGLRILLGTDGSSPSLEAIRSVARRPWPERSEARVVGVSEGVEPFPPEVPWGAEMKELDDLAWQRAQEAVEAGRGLLAEAGVPVTGGVLAGDPKACLLDEVERWQADLVVVGSHGRRGADHLLFGSVSEAVAVQSPCSVEVIREPLPRPAAGE